MDEKVKDEGIKHHQIIVGNNLSDCEAPNMTDLEEQDAHDAFWGRCFDATWGQAIEIQYEGNLQLKLWENFPDMIGQRPLLGVHQPLKARNTISPTTEVAEQSMADTLLAMDMAQHIGANYYVYHLTSVDDWVNPRSQQLQQAYLALDRMAEHYNRNNHNYAMALEIPLEYPKHPASEQEIIEVIGQVLSSHPGTVLIFDVAHHWHNQRLVPAEKFSSNYQKRLSDLLIKIEDTYPGAILGFHLGGSYINTETDKHETHDIPGHVPSRTLETPTDFEYGKPIEFTGEWMKVEEVLHALVTWSKHAKRELRLILEVNDINDRQRNLARTAIKEKLAKIYDYV